MQCTVVVSEGFLPEFPPQLRVAKCLDSFNSHDGHPFLYIAIIKASLNCCGSSLAIQ